METRKTGWNGSLAPFGIPVVFIANDPQLLATVMAAYVDWTADVPIDQIPIEIRLELSDLASSNDVSCDIRVEGSRLSLKGCGTAGWADLAARQAYGVVPPKLVGDPVALAAEVTDTLLLFLLARSGRTPIHAAGVMSGDTALVLTGPSGSGKSTLALAAARRGLGILSDDTIYVQTEPGLRLWGMPRPIHVLPEHAPAAGLGTRLRGGKLKSVVPLPSVASRTLVADRARLLVLDRGERVRLDRVDPDMAMASLARLEPGFDLLREASATAARALTATGAWRLTLSGNPDEAIDLLLDQRTMW